jgi:PAS domain S-box-containing protein
VNSAQKISSKLNIASVKALEEENSVFYLSLKLDVPMTFTPGQYVWIILPSGRSAFSIFDYSEDQTEITILFKKGESDYKKELQNVQVGNKVEILGPFGSALTFEKDYTKELNFVAGGVGIAPFLAQIKYHTLTKSKTRINLFYFTDEVSSRIQKEIENYKEKNKNFNFKIEKHPYKESLNQLTEDTEKTFCVIGSQNFVDATYSLLLARGINREDMAFEQNYPLSPWKKSGYDFMSDDTDTFKTSRERVLTKFIFWLLLAGAVFTGISGAILYSNGVSVLVHIITELIFLSLLVFWFLNKNLKIISNLLIGMAMFVMVYSLFTNISGIYILFWLPLIPILTFLLIGMESNKWNLGYLVIIYIYLALVLLKIIPERTDTVSLVNSVLSVTMISILIYIDSIVDKNRWEVLRKNLEKLNIFKQAVESSSNHIVITDENGFILFANKSAQKITGFDWDAMLNNTPRLWGGEMASDFYQKLWLTKNEKTNFDGEINNRRKDNSLYVSLAHISPITINNKVMGYIGTEDDITEKKELSRIKDEFLSIASHELRTPMTAIKGFISMVLEGDYGELSTKMKEPLLNIQTSTERLIHLVNDLLNLTRIEAGRFKLNLENFDSSKVINESIYSLLPIAEEKGLKLTVKKTAKCSIQADMDNLRQIIVNLVGNSLKFTPKGEIYIEQTIEGEFAKFSVIDTGIGIAKEDVGKIFGKFEQIHSNEIGKPQGTGLGLYICKTLVEKMGGTMWVEKSVVGKGSTFSFTLPLSQSKIAEKVKLELEKEAKDHPDQKTLAT